ncbi:MAG: hypothetical protein HYY06_17545 [Deltaproteobacteria bacterium]|nr:hypothetical protein [Deltaproteobacteria bacterium]
MATWAEVQNHMRSTYTLAADQPEWLSLDFQFENKRLQRIILSTFQALGKNWVSFRSRICRREQMDPEVAVRKTGNFAVGAIGLIGEGDNAYYEMIYSTMLETLDPEELELPLHVICRTADEIEAEITHEDIA